MQNRYSLHPDYGKTLDTAALRDHFLIDPVFVSGEANLVYSHFDRIIVGGVCPGDSVVGLEGGKALGTEHFLERRELGAINIGGAGSVTVDGSEYALGPRDGIYIGMGAQTVQFASADPSAPAKFYLASAPAHASYPTVLIDPSLAKEVRLGSQAESNLRTIYQYVHPAVLKSCQLVMGLTMLDEENVWNTMPCHTHERRMEVYLYFDLDADARVFHLTGPPDETRHIVVANEQAVISPSWSIHSGVGTTNYSFIWAMVGENQEFTDMDHVPMDQLR